jgi:D-serine deaminase-like pyridoxal phosphate-dependent protein
MFSCLIDDKDVATHLATVFHSAKQTIDVYIDLNVGMNRTGIVPSSALPLLQHCASTPGLRLVGLHAYDGHLRDADMTVRTKQCDDAFEAVTNLQHDAKRKLNIDLRIVAGGTPTYSIHKNRRDVECSPGTFIYWDKGYEQVLKEQQYLHAALVITRVISKPSEGILCVDLGHKAIASENPLANRVTILNGVDLVPSGHSEEHMVLTTNRWNDYHVGDVLYGVPYHVCPTIALHDEAIVVNDHTIVDRWTNESRKRKINV